MSACVDELFVQSELVAKVAWGDEPVSVVGEAIESLARSRNRVDLGLLLAVRSYEARGEHRAEGHASVVGYLQHHLGMKKSAARRVARLSKFVAQHPSIEEGMRAGFLSFDHVELLADAYQPKHAEVWDDLIPVIVAHAEGMRFEDLARHVLASAQKLDPKDAEEDFEQKLEDRSVSFTTTLDGMGYGRLWLEPFAAQIFGTELERLYQIEFQRDWAFAKDTLGRNPDMKELAELTRTVPQRRHDALKEMALRSKAHAGGKTAASYCVILHTTWDTYQAALAHAVTGEDLVVPDDGFCETHDGAPITPMAAVHASLVGQVRRIVFGADDEILDFGRARRCYSDAQALAIQSKLRRCAHPFGCDVTGIRLQTDHRWEHEGGGPTDIGNADVLHDAHNRWKTNTKHDPPKPGRRDTGQRRGPPPWFG